MPPPAAESIAVVLPVYKGAAYLAEAIESVHRQTLPPAEFVVIDDGSPDDSAAIARGFEKVTVLTQANAGVSAARNRGVALTTSPWIAFIDQDDIWEPAKLERQMSTLAAHPEADVCFTGQQGLLQVADTDTFVRNGISIPPTTALAQGLYGRLRFVPSCTIVRRSAFTAAGGFRSSAQPCEDWDLWLRMEQAGASFVACPESLLLYRLHSGNGSNDGEKMYRGELRVYDSLIGPRVAPLLRPLHRLRAESGFRAGMSLIDREQGRPHLSNMLLSLVSWPFGHTRRYKFAASMLLHGGRR